MQPILSATRKFEFHANETFAPSRASLFIHVSRQYHHHHHHHRPWLVLARPRGGSSRCCLGEAARVYLRTRLPSPSARRRRRRSLRRARRWRTRRLFLGTRRCVRVRRCSDAPSEGKEEIRCRPSPMQHVRIDLRIKPKRCGSFGRRATPRADYDEDHG